MRKQDTLAYDIPHDKTVVEGTTYPDISRIIDRGVGTIRQSAQFRLWGDLPNASYGKSGSLQNGEYIVGFIRGNSIIRSGTAVVLTKFTQGVKIDVGFKNAPALAVGAFNCAANAGTVVTKHDCDTYVPMDGQYLIAKVTGIDDTKAISGEVAILVEFDRLDYTTNHPSR